VDLSGTHLLHLQFRLADLAGSSFQNAQVIGCNFAAARLMNCSFSDALVGESSFLLANLDNSSFSDARLFANRFNGASLTAVSFDRVNWGHTTTYSPGSVAEQYKAAPLPRNDFSDAVGIEESIAQQAAGPPSVPGQARWPGPERSQSRQRPTQG
jgi:uncharacterized protein YjbI with pentapeptide repeats